MQKNEEWVFHGGLLKSSKVKAIFVIIISAGLGGN